MTMLILSILSTFMLSVSRILIAMISQSESFNKNYLNWLNENDKKIKLCDEMLAISSLLFSVYITLSTLQITDHFTFFTATILVSLLYCNIAWIGVVLILGNIVYPVNGIRNIGIENMPTNILQIYSRMHLSELSLGLLTISLAYSSNSSITQVFGYFVGILQIISTYYSQPIKYKFYIFSVIIWNIWIIIFQLSNSSLIHLL